MSIYREFGLEPIINVSGTVTRLGGAPMPEPVLDAFRAAAREAVPLDLLQARASRILAEITGAEAGLVVSGAAAGLMLGTAAILARLDPARMERLPHCDDFPHEMIVARDQRNGYDHAVRAAGVRLVDVGCNEIVAGAGVRRPELWEYAAAIGPRTAGILVVYDPQCRPPLAEIVSLARERELPVLVDAAGELPPRRHLRELPGSGADLVVFSGGKAIRGPQASGILCGRRDLIASAALQMLDMDDHPELWDPPPDLIDRSLLSGMPRHGIGRALKVSKEQIVALLTAVRLFASGAYDAELPGRRRLLEKLAAGLEGWAVECRLKIPEEPEAFPLLEIVLKNGRSAFDVCRALRQGTPSIQVGHGLLSQGVLIIHPLHLTEDTAAVLLGRLREELPKR